MTTFRLARFLARAGAASRRGAADLVAADRVRLNGRPPVGPGDPVDPARDVVTLDGRRLTIAAPAWLALHKPAGYVTSRRATPRHPSAFDLMAHAPPGTVPVGRLDVYSEGLLLWTTDGDAAHRLTHPSWEVPRRYRVEVAGTMGPEAGAALEAGVRLADAAAPARPTAWRFTRAAGGGTLELELREGRNRVVRRLCQALGLGVRRLVRVAYGPVELGRLPPGATRPLTASELAALYAAVALPVPLP